MRRAPVVITVTVAGFAGALAFQAHPPQAGVIVRATPAAGGTTASGTTVTGDAVDTQYGAAQVRVTISGGRITAVDALQLQASDPKSAQISGGAEPQLRASALARQSADVDAVSGATVTSASYEASLQSALDKAGFQAADGSRGSSEIPQVEEHDGPGGGDGFEGPPDDGFGPVP